jgi:hypothetical protein
MHRQWVIRVFQQNRPEGIAQEKAEFLQVPPCPAETRDRDGTSWRWVQSAANPSLLISLIDGKILGKSALFRPFTALLCRQLSVLTANFCGLWAVSKIRNRELTGIVDAFFKLYSHTDLE